MGFDNCGIEALKKQYPKKFATENYIFSKITKGSRIFISTACGEPQYLVNALIKYVETHPKAIIDSEIYHVWTLGVAPYVNAKFKQNFRHNSFFVGNNTRDIVNKGLADYTPVFLSNVPKLFINKLVVIDVALIQTSLPDKHGYVSLGISVDIVKAATQAASLVIAQINAHMPRTHGDGFIHINDVDFIVHHDEPVLEYNEGVDSDVAQSIGKHVAKLIQDGDTLQVGYGSIPDKIMANLSEKNQLGIHTELLTDGIVALMQLGVIDNTRKTTNREKTVATFCMGKRNTYEFIDDNPTVLFRTIDYTNNPLIIAQHENMVAINSALEVDLTGQASAESIGKLFFSGIGGQADFMRGAVLAKNGKTILTLQSTAENQTVSRIVPFLREGAGATLNRGDIHYLVTEYGIAYLHGKNIRERAMQLISIAHPAFRQWLIDEAKRLGLIYKDQCFIEGEGGKYPEAIEVYRKTKTGLEIFLRPVKISDEPLLKEFFYLLSEETLFKRFLSIKQDMPHERLQEFTVIDYTKDMALLALIQSETENTIIAIGQYTIDENTHMAEIAFLVRDDYQGQGIGTELIKYLTYIARKKGLLGFTAEVLITNTGMIHLFESMDYDIDKDVDEGMYFLKMIFKR
ncbi:MAG: GNAT family N-acetyltransferase [Candidatus Magnetoovum sp. WYHC-5]|nr:GNAT family N-acetyltransferase [Candidatus Magnetoovum sp. WYHC-5]